MQNSLTQPITVGASLSLSGRFAAQGQQACDGLTLWAEDANRAGGLLVASEQDRRAVQPVVYDDASKRAIATEHTRRLITEDRVDLLFGPYSSVLALAAAEVAAEHNRTLWNHGGSSDSMGGPDGDQPWQHVVNLLSPASSYFVPVLDMAVQTATRPIRRVALVHGARGTFPAAVIAGAEAHARTLGLEVVLKATYPERPSPSNPLRCAGEGEMQSFVREVARHEPDVILGVGTTGADIAFARELRAQGVKAGVVGLVAAAVQPFLDALGADADGFCGPSQWEPTLQSQPEIGLTSAEFAATFLARFGHEPDYPAAQAYAAGLIAGHCIGLANSLDDHTLRAVAATLDTSTFYGRFRTDPQTGRQVGHQIVVMQWQARRKHVVWPVTTRPISTRPGGAQGA